MQLATVIGSATSTTREEGLRGRRLVLLQPTTSDAASTDGPPLLAIDSLGVRRGDRVVITSDGTQARALVGHPRTPARWSVLGVVDGND